MRLYTRQDARKTRGLWQNFMPRRKELRHKISENLFSVQVFPPGESWMKNGWDTWFDKWAAMQVEEDRDIPDGMEMLKIPAGMYAVFAHTGGPQNAGPTFRHIMEEWLPASGFNLDLRPHFEVMDEQYSNSDPLSIEWIYVPVK
jgi:AraC family transcriptional regulator